ncbi:MAG: hypothetical protein HY067_13015 [Betaproteobacteria bacterium]|nr:hypothetical protein [Betaproteobacteria bacterium]
MADDFPSYPRAVRPAPNLLAHYLRIGRNDHRQVLNLAAAGDLACFGAVFDPTSVDRHRELFDVIISRRLDAILDPRTQPSATPGGFSEGIGNLPWGVGRPHSILDFSGTSGRRMVAALGDFVIDRGFTQVLAPTHLLRSSHDEWLEIDIEATKRLRDFLDRKNSSRIPIVYSLALTYAMLRNPDDRHQLIDALHGIPANAIWLKVDGFGSDSTATAVRSYIEAAADFREIGLPLVSDLTGGLVGLSLLAFGATGGLAHGITSGERFDAGGWRRVRSGSAFGSHHRVYVPQLDILLKPEQAHQLLETSSRAKSLFGCRDTRCCPRGTIDMLENPARHFMYQRIQQVLSLSQIPEQLRAARFLDKYLRPTTDHALAAANIKWRDEKMAKKMREQRKRLDTLRVTLGEYETKEQKQPPAFLPKTRAFREARV